jgi:hypothetical protein
LNRKEGEIGNPLKRADIYARFFQPIHQRHEVVAAGSQTSPRMDPAFQGLFAGFRRLAGLCPWRVIQTGLPGPPVWPPRSPRRWR